MTDISDGQESTLSRARRNRFENLGSEIVRADLARGGHIHIGGPQAQEAARQWLAEKNSERTDAKRNKLRQRTGVFLSGGSSLLNIVKVLGGVGVGLFLGWMIWGGLL